MMKASKRRSKSSMSKSSQADIVSVSDILTPKPHRVDHILCSYFRNLRDRIVPEGSQTRSVSREIVELRNTVQPVITDKEDNEILSEIKQRLETYTQLEQHLHQAKAEAISLDEQQLNKIKDEFPGCHSDTNHTLLPIRQPTVISNYLNESLLKEHALLSPSECIPATHTTHLPPKEKAPSYLNATVTSDLHARVKQSEVRHHTEPKSDSNDGPLSTTHQWKNTLSSVEKELSKAAVSELQRKVTFLHNPRQSAHKHVNTASHGPIKTRGLEMTKERDTNMFIAEPPHLMFTDYTPGTIYEQSIDFRNVSGASRQLRIVPPTSPYFKARIAHFPNSEGIIAPGMTCTYTVQFLPDSLANFTDELQVVMHTGECLTVPLKGYRPSPDLSISSSLECGHCLVGGCSNILFPCANNGGEGEFKILLSNKEAELELGALRLGPFTISPSEFHLLPEDSVDIKVEFRPVKAGLFSFDFQMACDNGQIHDFIVSGSGDMVSVTCDYISQSANSVSTALKYAESAGHAPTDWSLCDDDNQGGEGIDEPLVQFDHTNPGVPLYKIAVVKNNSGVTLPYQWGYYHPCTELSNTISPLVVNNDGMFSIEEGTEELLPGQTKLIPIQYKPYKVGDHHVMAFLQLKGIPMAALNQQEEGWSWLRLGPDTVTPLLLELKGHSEPYSVQLSPPLVNIINGLPPLTEKKQTIKILNNSISPVSFEWKSVVIDQCSIIMEPATGSIVPGGYQYCDCCVNGTDISGSFNIPLHCSITHDSAHTLHIQGCVQEPVVNISSASVEYGLIQLGHGSIRILKLTNESNGEVRYSLKQVTVDSEDNSDTNGGIVDYDCLSFSPESGFILPSSNVNISMTCRPVTMCGRLRTAILLSINDKKYSVIPVCAEVQRPSVVLEQSSIYLDSCYVGVPHTYQVTLINRGLLPAHYQWANQAKYDHCQIVFSPVNGTIGPKKSTVITMTSTWMTQGYHTGVVSVCNVEASSEPLLLSVSSRVLGLTVHYSLENSTDSDNDDSLILNYGPSNPIGQPQVLQLIVTNTSAVSTSLSACIKHYKAQDIPVSTEETKTKRTGLLSITENIVNPGTKTAKQKAQEMCDTLLSDGRGCAFTVSPAQCTLPPFKSQSLTITAYSDMWGQYKDHLICKVDGIEARYFPINYGVTGSPIVFQTTATSGQTVVRFGCRSASAKVVTRNLRLFNSSLTDIRVDWRVFNYSPDDDKLVDLITAIGHPFPLLTDTPRAGDISDNGDDSGEDNGDSVCSPLVRAIIQPHEGVPSSGYPFKIEPEQMTLSAKSSSSIAIHLDPSIQVYNEFGEHIKSYILGYCSLDTKSPLGCVRDNGYDVSPLRIDMTAIIQHPTLVIETDHDDNSFMFTHAASELVRRGEDGDLVREILPSVMLSHDLTLTNLTDTTLTWHLSPLSHPYSLQLKGSEDVITLQPRQKIMGEIEYLVQHSDIINLESTELTSTDDIVITYTTGAIQKCSLLTKILLPHLSILPSVMEYGVVHLSQCRTAAVQLRNDSYSLCIWKASIPSEFENIVSINPQEGILGVSDDEGQPLIHTLTVTFTPRTETAYSINISITEMITQTCQYLTVTGSGSVDEGVVTRKKRK